jgi:ABC-type antimicrobial peptide transport system permease subunit
VFYRLITLIGGLVFVAALFGLIWFFCKKFLQHQGVTEQVDDRATVLATWTFAGVAVGLVFAVVGAFVLGPWAFYRTLRGHDVDVSDAAAIWWGLGIVVLSLGIVGAGFFGFLMLVGAY